MLEKINKLAELLAQKAPGQIRIAFNEEDRTTAKQPEAAHFLKFTLDGVERRMGRDLELYNFMATVAGEQAVICDLLGELVMPLKSYTPEAYKAGIDFLREQAPVFGERAAEWTTMLDGM